MQHRDWLTGKPSSIEFKIMLALIEDIQTEYHYEWWAEWAGGYPENTIDRICSHCGQVTQVGRDRGWTCGCGVQYDVIFLDGSPDGMEGTMKQIQALMVKQAGTKGQ